MRMKLSPPTSASRRRALWLAELTALFSLACSWLPVHSAEAPRAASGTSTHWSFRPLTNPPVPDVQDVNWARSEIDRFLLARLMKAGIRPSAPADKRTLIRRATFDLTGLPPTPEEVDAFLADESANAFDAVIERLLASPHYGERWGRHWLDVVRYADTAGETADFPVPHAWRYRNYVIDAFNHDKPYNEFLREQVAGDILAAQLPVDAPPERYRELLVATGYISIARRFGFDTDKDLYLTIDDTLDTVSKSVLGLALGCARCHDHKYDPISVEDYYALYGIFESTRFPFPGCEKTKSPRDMVPLMTPADWERIVKPHQQQVSELDRLLQDQAGKRTAAANRYKEASATSRRELGAGAIDNGGQQPVAQLDGKPLPPVEVRRGDLLLLSILPRGNHGADSTTVELALAEVNGNDRWSLTADALEEFHSGNPHRDRQGNPRTWCFLDVRDGAAFLSDKVRDIEKHPGLHVWRLGELPSALINETEAPIKAWTATFPPRSFAVHPSAAGGVAVGWISPIDGPVSISGLVADADAAGGDGVAWKVELISQATGDLLALADLENEVAATRVARDQLVSQAPRFDLAYAVAEGSPHDAQIQRRGDPENRGDFVPRRFLSVLGGAPVPPGSGSGRLELAESLASPDNPLTPRVIVNRIWQHHFGAGLVNTPSDFGMRGADPSHPELIDYLARRFIDGGWSIKGMHRLIMKSAAWQQASADDPERARVDAGDVLWWRFRSRRLSAEEIRDTILAVTGELDPTPGGPHPFPDEKSWGFTQHGPFNAVYDHNRRSVYLMTQRIKRHPFLTLFDGPDANSSTADRFSTTVPTQALFFANDPFVHTKAEAFAGRLMALPDDDARLDRTWRLAFSRLPEVEERAAAHEFLKDYSAELTDVPEAERPRQAWSAWLRVVLSSNELIYID